MKIYIFLLPIFFLSVSLHAQYLDWYKRMGGDTQCRTYAITYGNGYVYSAGVIGGTTDFDPDDGGWSFTCPSSNGGAFITKHDSVGNLIWVKTLADVTGGCSTKDIELDSWGNVYLVGSMFGTLDFDPGPGTYNLGPSYANTEAYVLKLDANGNFKWAHNYSGSIGENAAQAVTTAEDKVLITGSFQDTVDFNSGPGTFELVSFGSSDIFLLELDTSGSFVWAKNMGSSGGESGTDVKVDSNNDIILAGSYQDGADMDPGPGTYYLNTPDDPFGYFVAKYTSLGSLVWAKSIQGVHDGMAHHLAIDDYNNIFTGGSFSDTMDFDPGLGVYEMIAPFGVQDLYVMKLDENGIFKWAKQITGNDHSAMISLNMNDRFVFFTGQLWGNYDFDPGNDTCFLNSSTPYHAFLAALDTAGNFATAMQMRGSWQNWGSDLVLNNNDLYFTGYYSDSIDIDPTNLVNYIHVINTVYSANSFILKLGLQGIGIPEQPSPISCITYPNPTNSLITVSSLMELKEVQLVLTDIKGQTLIYKNHMNGKNLQLDLSSLSSGMYFLHIYSQGKEGVIKVVKN